RFGNRPSEMEVKYLLFFLLALGALAGWADSEAVLPAYIIGMVLAGTVGKDHALVRRMRAMTFGPDDAVLFHPRWRICLDPSAYHRALCILLHACQQDGKQVRRCLSGNPRF